MSYSARFTLKLQYSPEVFRIAADIGRGFDPDSGGDRSFARDIVGWNEGSPIYGDTFSTDTPCEPEFKAMADYLMTDANALYEAMQQKYAERWADLVPPTLEECQLFINAIIPEVVE